MTYFCFSETHEKPVSPPLNNSKSVNQSPSTFVVVQSNQPSDGQKTALDVKQVITPPLLSKGAAQRNVALLQASKQNVQSKQMVVTVPKESGQKSPGSMQAPYKILVVPPGKKIVPSSTASEPQIMQSPQPHISAKPQTISIQKIVPNQPKKSASTRKIASPVATLPPPVLKTSKPGGSAQTSPTYMNISEKVEVQGSDSGTRLHKESITDVVPKSTILLVQPEQGSTTSKTEQRLDREQMADSSKQKTKRTEKSSAVVPKSPVVSADKESITDVVPKSTILLVQPEQGSTTSKTEQRLDREQMADNGEQKAKLAEESSVVMPKSSVVSEESTKRVGDATSPMTLNLQTTDGEDMDSAINNVVSYRSFPAK